MKNNKPRIQLSIGDKEWKKTILGEISEIKTGPFGSALHAKDYVVSGTPIITTEHFKNGELPPYMAELPQVSNEDYERLGSYRLKHGDLVFSRVGSVDINALVTEVQNGWLFSGRVLRVRPIGNIDGSYLHYLLDTTLVKNDILSRAVGQTMPSINTEILKNTQINLSTDVQEQVQIGSLFKSLDETISLHQQELEALKQTKQGFLQKLFPSEIGVMPDIRFESSNSDWEIYKLSELGETFTGLSGLSKDDFNDGECKYVTYMNVFSNTVIDINNLSAVNLSKNKKQNKLKSGDILFTTSSEKAEEVGMASYFGHNLDNVYLNSFCFGFRPNNSKVDSLFLAYFMRSNMIRTRLNKLAQGSTRYNLSKAEMMKMTISLPSLSEQLKIRALFRKLDEIIELKEKELEALKETKKGFLQKMFV